MKITDLPTGPYTPPLSLLNQILAATAKGYRVSFQDARPDRGEPPLLKVECRIVRGHDVIAQAKIIDVEPTCNIPIGDRLSMTIGSLVSSLELGSGNG